MNAQDRNEENKQDTTMEEEFVENAGEPEEMDADGMPISDANDPFEDSPQRDDNAAEEKYKRLMADYDNYRRRTAKESLQQQQKGRREAAAKLLPVIDSLTMAMLSIPADNPARGGIEATMRQAIACFDDLGIERIATKGEPFDPELHEAIGHLPSAEYPEGVVCEESRAGFCDSMGLLRPAQVLVSSGNGG